MVYQGQDPTPVRVSTHFYRLLLKAYPEEFRREYGPHMAQIFRDACLKAYRREGAVGLTALWIRIGYDLWKTSLEERMQAGIFLCPCHYSQYQQDGTAISGPTTRSTDRFVIRLLDDNGVEVAATDSSGNPLPLPDENLNVVVNTGKLIRGQPKGIRYPIENS